MLENLTAIPLTNTSLGSMAASDKTEVSSLDSTRDYSFKSLFNKDLMKAADFQNSGLIRLGLAAEQGINHSDLSALNEKLLRVIEQWQSGNALPLGGKTLPISSNELDQLLQDIQASLQSLSQPQPMSQDIAVEQDGVPEELLALLNRLAVMADQLSEMEHTALTEQAVVLEQPAVDTYIAARLNSHNSGEADLQAQVEQAPLEKTSELRQWVEVLQGFSEALSGLNAEKDVPDGLSASNSKNTHLSIAHMAVVQHNPVLPEGIQQKITLEMQLESIAKRLDQALSKVDALVSKQQGQNGQSIAQITKPDDINNLNFLLPMAVQATAVNNALAQTSVIAAAETARQLIGQAQEPLTNVNLLVSTPAVSNANIQSTLNVSTQAFSTQVGLPMTNAQWGDQFIQRVSWLATQGITSADIKLNPAELGPIQIRIENHEDSARVVFTAHNVNARESIEQNLPRLRELFSAQGLDLLEVDVESHNEQRDARSNVEQEDDQQLSVTDNTDDDSSVLATTGEFFNTPLSSSLALSYGRVDAFA